MIGQVGRQNGRPRLHNRLLNDVVLENLPEAQLCVLADRRKSIGVDETVLLRAVRTVAGRAAVCAVRAQLIVRIAGA